MKRSTALLTALFVMFLTGGSPLAAETLYGISRTGDVLIRIDEDSGQATTIGSLGINLSAVGADVHPDGTLYGLTSPSGELFSVDLATGAATVVQTFDTSGLDNTNGVGIAFAPDGRLFWRNREFLHLLDMESGNLETVATLATSASNLTRTPDGQGFYSWTTTGHLTRIELSSLSETVIGFTGVTGGFNSLALSSDGRLYGERFSNDLYIVDQSTGNATLVGPLGHDVPGMAFVIPEPSSLTLAAVVALTLLVHRHRRRRV